MKRTDFIVDYVCIEKHCWGAPALLRRRLLIFKLSFVCFVTTNRKVAGSRPDGVNDFYQFT
jgi:hypothetical protein